jgi:hypothetical protein
MERFKMYLKFAWVYTTSLFVPTAIVTPRVEKLVKEFEELKAREAAKKQASH